MGKDEDVFKHLKECAKNEVESLDNLTLRINKEEERRGRNEFQRDYTRIIYSSSFRRLQGKMQLLGVQTDKFFRNRLTHSFEVAQIARAIAENVGYSNTYVVEACSLAHDIGNPPFGHYGEKILNDLCKNIGGFEGNAQTLRVLTSIEKKNPDNKGLNLTLRTLLGVVKYNKKLDAIATKFIYDDDYDILNNYAEQNEVQLRTLDVQIVDLADEIAYAAHDLEDALSLKLFTIDELLYEYHLQVYEKKANSLGYDTLNELVGRAKSFAHRAGNFSSSEEYAFLLRKEIMAGIVNRLINDIDFVVPSEKKIKDTGTIREKELGFKTLESMANTLKKITFNCINRSDLVQIYEKQGETIIRGLYELFMDPKFNSQDGLLPPEYRTKLNKHKQRTVVDYIAGMMESYALATYRKYYGESSIERIYQEYRNQKRKL